MGESSTSALADVIMRVLVATSIRQVHGTHDFRKTQTFERAP
jgi:hypothetical protein